MHWDRNRWLLVACRNQLVYFKVSGLDEQFYSDAGSPPPQWSAGRRGKPNPQQFYMKQRLPFLLDDMPKQLTIRQKFSNQKKAFLCFHYFVKSHNITMPNPFQDLDFFHHSLHIFGTHLWLIDYLYRHLFACRKMQRQMDLSEGALADVLSYVFKKIPRR